MSSLLAVGLDRALAGRIEEVWGTDDVQVEEFVPADPGEARSLANAKTVIVCGLPRSPDGLGQDELLRASAGVYHMITSANDATHFILISSLGPFERYPADRMVTEYWAPRPTTDVADLVALAAESVVREVAHVAPLRATCLRVGEIVDDAGPRHQRAVHVDDVCQAIARALEHQPVGDEPSSGWRVFHIVGLGETRFPLGLATTASEYPNGGRGSSLGYVPEHDVTGHEDVRARPSPDVVSLSALRGGRAKRVLILGAGGPFGELTARTLMPDHELRLTDVTALDASMVAGSDSGRDGGAGPSNHELAVVDVTDPDQVLDAMTGIDAVVNLTVVREDPSETFRVNTVGAYNVARAAAESGIRRVVLTGPNQVFNPMNGAYWPDFHLGSDVPQRPGSHIYMLSKFVGQEICRVFAEEHDLEMPVLVFGYFANPGDGPHPLGGHPFMVSWADTAEAIRSALRVPEYPRPFEVFHIQGDMPHGKYRNDRAKEVLGWQPRDDLDTLWLRP